VGINSVPDQELEYIEHVLKPVQLPPLAETPLVSVLMANYNYGRYIRQAIDSVLAQTYQRFELIVCDDGSTDDSREVVARYVQTDQRIKLVCQENGGMSSAQNAAFSRSSGQIVCLLDADDRFMPEKLEKLVQAFRAQPNGGCLSHQMFRTDASGRRLGVSPAFIRPPDGWYGPFVVRNGDLPPGMAFGSGICLRREICKRIFPLPERFRGNTDGVIMASAPLMTVLIGISAPLTEYRCHGANDWNSFRVSLESLDRDLKIGEALWELRKNYLESVDPRLSRIFPGFDQRLSTTCSTYVRSKLRPTEDVLPAYRAFTRSKMFLTLHLGARWFWRLSVVLPQPLFRRAVNLVCRPNRVKQGLWWLVKYLPREFRRRVFAN
jgi:glycosyltransferase involved in cell wall biosynthesis